MRRRVLALLQVLALVVPLLIVLANPAQALPLVGSTGALSGSGGTSCKQAPTPAMPGTGVPGFFDKVDHHTAGTSVYDQYGYAGLTWNTYDIGCIPDPYAILDTTMGNAMMGVAVTVVSLSNALHEFVSNPHLLGALDPVLRQATAAVRRAILTPWIGLSLLLLGIVVLWAARGENLPRALTATGQAVLVLAIATAAVSAPLYLAHLADGMVEGSVGEVNTAMLGGNQHGDPAAVRSSEVVADILYRNWLRGEFGDPDSHTAKVYGRALFDAQAYTWGQAHRIALHPDQASSIAHGKATAWDHLTGKIKKADPTAYYEITGHARNRWGASWLADISVALALLFLVFADLFVVIAMIVFVLGIVALPAMAPFAIHSPALQRALLHRMFGGMVGAVLYAFGAGVQLIAIHVFLGSPTTLPEWASLLITGVVSLVLWRVLWTLRHISRITQGGYNPVDQASMDTSRHRKRLLGYAGRAASTFIGARTGAESGVRAATEDKPAAEPVAPATASYTRPAEPYRAAPTPTRPDPAPAIPAGPNPPREPAPTERVAVDSGTTIVPKDAPTGRPMRRADPTWVPGEGWVYQVHADPKDADNMTPTGGPNA